MLIIHKKMTYKRKEGDAPLKTAFPLRATRIWSCSAYYNLAI